MLMDYELDRLFLRELEKLRAEECEGTTVRGVNPLARAQAAALIDRCGTVSGADVASFAPEWRDLFYEVRRMCVLFVDEPDKAELTRRVADLLCDQPSWEYRDVRTIIDADVAPTIEELYRCARVVRDAATIAEAQAAYGTVRSETVRSVADTLAHLEWRRIREQAEADTDHRRWVGAVQDMRNAGMSRTQVAARLEGQLSTRAFDRAWRATS